MQLKARVLATGGEMGAWRRPGQAGENTCYKLFHLARNAAVALYVIIAASAAVIMRGEIFSVAWRLDGL